MEFNGLIEMTCIGVRMSIETAMRDMPFYSAISACQDDLEEV